jgi:polyisoprenoid-binding protein YceI
MPDNATQSAIQTWNVDPSHSSIDFKIKHMAIASVKGNFKTFSGIIQTNQGELSSVEATIEASSVTTNDEKRDGHLQSPDFFDVANHPKLTFKSTKIEKASGSDYKVTGDLTMRGITKPVTFTAEVAAPIKDPWGLTRAAANISGKLNRKEWNLNWNQVLELGALLVGEEVIFDFDVEAVAQA